MSKPQEHHSINETPLLSLLLTRNSWRKVKGHMSTAKEGNECKLGGSSSKSGFALSEERDLGTLGWVIGKGTVLGNFRGSIFGEWGRLFVPWCCSCWCPPPERDLVYKMSAACISLTERARLSNFRKCVLFRYVWNTLHASRNVRTCMLLEFYAVSATKNNSHSQQGYINYICVMYVAFQ